MNGRSDADPDDRRDLGGDPACWAHLFDEKDNSDDTDEATIGDEVVAHEGADDRAQGGGRCAPS